MVKLSQKIKNVVLSAYIRRPVLFSVGAGLIGLGYKIATQDFTLPGTFDSFNYALDQMILSGESVNEDSLVELREELPKSYEVVEDNIRDERRIRDGEGPLRFDPDPIRSEPTLDQQLYEVGSQLEEDNQSAARDELIELRQYSEDLADAEQEIYAYSVDLAKFKGGAVSTSAFVPGLILLGDYVHSANKNKDE